MSNNTTCAFLSSDSTKLLINYIEYAAYFWIKPVCLVFDLLAHICCFFAFYKQYKTSGSVYAFQFYESIFKSVDTLAEIHSLAVVQSWSGLNYDGARWFQKSYHLMWFAAHVSFPLTDMTNTIALFVSLFMSIDRAYAIGRPIKYKLIDRRKWESISIFLSIFIGVSSSFFVSFYFNVEMNERSQVYNLVPDPYFGSSFAATILIQVRNVVWFSGAVTVIGSGSYLVYCYKKKQTQVANMTGSTSLSKKKQRKESEKTLFILTIYDSVQAVNETSILITHTILAFRPGFFDCEGPLFAAVRSIEIAIINASDFYLMLIASKAFRKIIRQGLPMKQTAITGPSGPSVQ